MNQRTLRLGAEIQAVLGEIIARGEIRDSRVRAAGLITITWVRVTGDLSEARVGFTVFGGDESVLDRARRGLEAARAYLQQELARRLQTRKTPLLSFDIDRSLDHAFRVDSLLREAASASRVADAANAAADPPGPEDGETAATGSVEAASPTETARDDPGQGKAAAETEAAGAGAAERDEGADVRRTFGEIPGK